jgi:hypothetical protein
VSKKSRVALIICASIALIVAFKVFVSFRQFSRVQREFQLIMQGESRASVRARFGMPNYYAGECGRVGAADKACKTEFIYSHPFAPILPEYYVVSFSSDGRVIDTEHWVSP